jgi:hypothetical protein
MTTPRQPPPLLVLPPREPEPPSTPEEIADALAAAREATRRARNGERLLPGTVRVRW